MPYLRSLDASHNSVTVVLGFVPPLNLQYVDLSFNKILEIPDLSAHRCLHHLALNSILFFVHLPFVLLVFYSVGDVVFLSTDLCSTH